MKIKFVPTNQEISGDSNKSLLQICTENQIEIKSICKGVPSCAECRVRIVQGEHNVLPPAKAEIALIGSSYYLDQRRLACQVRCFGDITVDIQEQLERAEFQSKKVRGFRTPGQKGGHAPTKAKQGTLVLEEGAKAPAVEASVSGNTSETPRPPNKGKSQNQGRRGGRR